MYNLDVGDYVLVDVCMYIGQWYFPSRRALRSNFLLLPIRKIHSNLIHVSSVNGIPRGCHRSPAHLRQLLVEIFFRNLDLVVAFLVVCHLLVDAFFVALIRPRTCVDDGAGPSVAK